MPPGLTPAYGWLKALKSFCGRGVRHPGCLDQDVEDRKERAATFLTAQESHEEASAKAVRGMGRGVSWESAQIPDSVVRLLAVTDPYRSARRRGLLLNASSWIR